MLLNLLSNAVKFVPKNGKISITCDLMSRGSEFGTIKVTVRDNGIGIKAKDLPKLFKLFGFLDSTKEINTNGIGLGLHICKKIAQIFGGDSWAESEYNKGSDFMFTFNLSQRQ